MARKTIIKTIQRFLGEVSKKGIPVNFAVLFGSQQNGHAHHRSDIDILVVSDSFDIQRRRQDIGLLWLVAAQIDSRIEPIAVGLKQWETDEATPIIEVARQRGRKIFPLGSTRRRRKIAA